MLPPTQNDWQSFKKQDNQLLVLPQEHHSTLKGWLRGDFERHNVAPLMYVGDNNSNRWIYGHSSPLYYVKKDENATLGLVFNSIEARYKTLFDMGVGGEKATKRALQLAHRIEAISYIAYDKAFLFAAKAARHAITRGFEAEVCGGDIFSPLNISRSNALVAVLGLTIGNLETLRSAEALKHRLTAIWSNYAQATYDPVQKSGLLVGWDANMNTDEVVSCYKNPEMSYLISTCIGRFIDTSKLAYEVRAVERKIEGDPTQRSIQLSTGLRVKEDHHINFSGERFPMREGLFLPVLNSERFSLNLAMESFKQGCGHYPPENQIWSTSGRVHYAHCQF